VKVSLTSNEENWSGVKFTLITGKAILEKETKIIIKFKNEGDIEFNIYPQNTFPNNIKEEILTQPQNNKIYDSYEGIFYYALNNRQENFVLNEEILHSWEVFQKVINYWKTTDKDLKYYTKYCSLNEVENK
jgi:glucose-6-phosphate 1-dehydrogenase